jgi:hypothetical protein
MASYSQKVVVGELSLSPFFGQARLEEETVLVVPGVARQASDTRTGGEQRLQINIHMQSVEFSNGL